MRPPSCLLQDQLVLALSPISHQTSPHPEPACYVTLMWVLRSWVGSRELHPWWVSRSQQLDPAQWKIHMLTWDNSRRPFTSLNNDCRTSPNTGLTHDLHRKWQSIVQSPSWSMKRTNYVNFPRENARFYLWRSFRNGCKRFFTCRNFSQQDNTQEELVTCWHRQQFCNKLWLSKGAFLDLTLWF